MKDEMGALDDLFVDESQTVSREVLRDLLVDYVQLTPDGKIFFLPSFTKLKSDEKILIVLLAKKVLKIKFGEDQLTSPKYIQSITGLPKGTVNPRLRYLEKEKYVQNIAGKYFIPNYMMIRARKILAKK